MARLGAFDANATDVYQLSRLLAATIEFVVGLHKQVVGLEQQITEVEDEIDFNYPGVPIPKEALKRDDVDVDHVVRGKAE
jgi:hypothetical protein